MVIPVRESLREISAPAATKPIGNVPTAVFYLQQANLLRSVPLARRIVSSSMPPVTHQIVVVRATWTPVFSLYIKRVDVAGRFVFLYIALATFKY